MTSQLPGLRAELRSLGVVWSGALALVVLDGFVLNQGLLSLFVGLWAVFSLLLLASGKIEHTRRDSLRSLILLSAALLVLLSNWLNNRMALDHAGQIITAVQRYNDRHGRYPDTLTALVPVFMEEIPAAKYSLFFNSFTYSTRAGEAYLSYMEMPPFGNPTYLFSSKQWLR